MAQHSHVPKFGNWDGENVPYTAYFENARRERGTGVRMNPNDPEQNPEAFMSVGSETPQHIRTGMSVSSEKHQVDGAPSSGHRAHEVNIANQHKNGTHRSMNSDSGSSKSASSIRSRNSAPKSFDEVPPHKATSVPAFGAWDEADPKSGDGFTVIFNQVKEEKHIRASKVPVVSTRPNTPWHGQKKSGNSSFMTKVCPCFPCGSK